ncbi:hypothetical protein BS47DRAFT_1353522, partial [Hydnum rufescens UP504]
MRIHEWAIYASPSASQGLGGFLLEVHSHSTVHWEFRPVLEPPPPQGNFRYSGSIL